MMAVHYEVCKTEKVQELNHELERELADLKAEVEENEMVHGIYRTIRYFAGHFRYTFLKFAQS